MPWFWLQHLRGLMSWIECRWSRQVLTFLTVRDEWDPTWQKPFLKARILCFNGPMQALLLAILMPNAITAQGHLMLQLCPVQECKAGNQSWTRVWIFWGFQGGCRFFPWREYWSWVWSFSWRYPTILVVRLQWHGSGLSWVVTVCDFLCWLARWQMSQIRWWCRRQP